LSSVKAPQCESCQQSLPEWWDEPWCPACPPGTNAYGQQDTDTEGDLSDPSALSTAPAGPPAAAIRAGLRGRRLVLGLGVAGVALLVAGIGVVSGGSEEKQDVASPAHGVLQEPCAQYRDLVRRAPAEDVGNDFIAWLGQHQGAFAEAARLDPRVTNAARAVETLDAYFSERTPENALSRDQLEPVGKLLVDACVKGPGRR
jgi:hypothetical protein